MTDILTDQACLIVLDGKGALPEWIRILPLGTVNLADGREPFEVTPAALTMMVSAFAARGIDLVVDYEHQSLAGDRAPAAGWIKEMQARDDGLWVRVEWTKQAGEYLMAKEYRYFSPVLRLDPETRSPTALMHIGLTNTPAINHLDPLVAKADEANRAQMAQTEKESHMKTKLQSLLGVTGDKPEEEILALADARFKLAGSLPEIAVALGLEKTADAATITGTILALKQGSEQLSTLRTELEALKAEHVQDKAQKAVDEALAAKKITPAQTEWALKYASENPEGFSAYVKAAVPVLASTKLKIPADDKRPGGVLDEDDLAICKSLNLQPEAYLAAKQA